MGNTFIAIDWGTTNRRAYRIEASKVVASESDDRGVTATMSRGFAGEVDAVRERLGDHCVLLAGMVGSKLGWVDAGYVAAPASLADLAEGLTRIDPRTAIVPGVSLTGEKGGDVMRGEEVQLLGAVEAGLAPLEALLCQPGTHCKWARVHDRAITQFTTAMTGEMFALIKAHSLVGREMIAPVEPGADFEEGVRRSARNDLLADLFSPRPSVLLGHRQPESVASFVSGLLIGTDCRAHARAGPVYLIADDALGPLYAFALATLGSEAIMVDSPAAFAAGMSRIRELSQ